MITGSDSGIGRAIAIAYAAESAKVVVTYHTDEEGGKQTVAQISEDGGDAICLRLDVTDEKMVAFAFDQIIQTYGRIDILVNNAGIHGNDVPVREMS